MTDKTALVTGAARRIGAAIARRLHGAGYNVVIHYNRSGPEAEALAGEFNRGRPDSSRAIQADLLDASAGARVVELALALNGRLDALVNNASMFYPAPLSGISETTWNEIVGTNLKAPLFLARHAAAQLQQNCGCIINLTDIHGARPLADHTLYSTAKAGLIMLTRALAKELAPAVRVNAVSPGAILWPPDTDDETREAILAQAPLGRLGTPDEVARAVCFLITEATYITGQTLAVDGGRSL